MAMKNGRNGSDPTSNVLDLVEAANRRQDDLREAHVRCSDEIGALRAEHTEKIAALRDIHAEKIRVLEADRLEKIRQAVETTVTTAADQALTAIQTLDRTTQATAERLRAAVETTATTIAKQTADSLEAITARLAALEQASYSAAGKSSVADPQLSKLVESVDKLTSVSATSGGRSAGGQALWGYIAGAVGLLVALAALAVNLAGTP